MSEKRQLQVVGECAYVTIETQVGKARQLLMKGAVFPADAPEAQHLLTTGLVAYVGGDSTGGVDADGNPAGDPAEVDQAAKKAAPAKKTTAKAEDADVEALRARAVKAGLDPDEVKKASPEDLRAALKE